MNGCHSWNPFLLKGVGQDLPKIESLRGGTTFIARKGQKPGNVKRGFDVEMGRGERCQLPLFFITLHFYHILHVGKIKSPLLLFSSSVF